MFKKKATGLSYLKRESDVLRAKYHLFLVNKNAENKKIKKQLVEDSFMSYVYTAEKLLKIVSYRVNGLQN